MPQTSGEPPADRDAAAAYLASILEHLARLSRHHHFDVLGFLLDMAQLEARNLRGQPEGPAGRTSR